MKLPESYPALLRQIAAHGYVAKSGNRASVSLATRNDNKHGLVLMWKWEPSDEDKRELEQVLSAEARVKRLPDLTSLENAEKVAEEMARCLGEPQII